MNGRTNPRKTAFIECRFDHGDKLTATGEWSEDNHWIEVYGGESGTVWVYADYVSERKEGFTVKNLDHQQVKIRSRPVDGKLKGYLKKNKTIEVDQVVLGWGKTPRGWIDLDYVEEVDGV